VLLVILVGVLPEPGPVPDVVLDVVPAVVAVALAPDPYDPRFRLTCDLYARGVTAGFASDDRATVVLQSAIYELPFGWIEASFDRSSLIWGTRRLERLTPAAELEIRRLRNRHRRRGIGAPRTADGARSASLDAADDLCRAARLWRRVVVTGWGP
jgi:hypothetical protein